LFVLLLRGALCFGAAHRLAGVSSVLRASLLRSVFVTENKCVTRPNARNVRPWYVGGVLWGVLWRVCLRRRCRDTFFRTVLAQAARRSSQSRSQGLVMRVKHIYLRMRFCGSPLLVTCDKSAQSMPRRISFAICVGREGNEKHFAHTTTTSSPRQTLRHIFCQPPWRFSIPPLAPRSRSSRSLFTLTSTTTRVANAHISY
jgi:hypothetical protein